jgi:transposase-like protein
LYGLKTSSERVRMGVHLSVLGLNVRAISEFTGHSEETITRWVARNGQHSERLHEKLFKGLVLPHIQVDEVVGKVRRWGRRVWVWTAQDAVSKAWLAGYEGRRTQAEAQHLIHQVVACLAPGGVPVFSSDGLRQ